MGNLEKNLLLTITQNWEFLEHPSHLTKGHLLNLELLYKKKKCLLD